MTSEAVQNLFLQIRSRQPNLAAIGQALFYINRVMIGKANTAELETLGQIEEMWKKQAEKGGSFYGQASTFQTTVDKIARLQQDGPLSATIFSPFGGFGIVRLRFGMNGKNEPTIQLVDGAHLPEIQERFAKLLE